MKVESYEVPNFSPSGIRARGPADCPQDPLTVGPADCQSVSEGYFLDEHSSNVGTFCFVLLRLLSGRVTSSDPQDYGQTTPPPFTVRPRAPFHRAAAGAFGKGSI